MIKLDQYKDKYRSIDLSRRDGILTVRLHSDGGPVVWGGVPHEELGYCFAEIAADRENELVILTGTGDHFIGAMDFPDVERVPAQIYSHLFDDAMRLLNNLLAIEVPVIGVVNGPARVHAELALLSDIVIAAEDAVFQDAPHFPAGLVPGDGVHVIWPMLLGSNRGRYFLLTGQEIWADEALDLGIVSEVMPRTELTRRANELADLLMKQTNLVRRFSRKLLVRPIQRRLFEDLGFGLSLEGQGWSDSGPYGLRIRHTPRGAEHDN